MLIYIFIFPTVVHCSLVLAKEVATNHPSYCPDRFLKQMLKACLKTLGDNVRSGN